MWDPYSQKWMEHMYFFLQCIIDPVYQLLLLLATFLFIYLSHITAVLSVCYSALSITAAQKCFQLLDLKFEPLVDCGHPVAVSWDCSAMVTMTGALWAAWKHFPLTCVLLALDNHKALLFLHIIELIFDASVFLQKCQCQHMLHSGLS